MTIDSRFLASSESSDSGFPLSMASMAFFALLFVSTCICMVCPRLILLLLEDRSDDEDSSRRYADDATECSWESDLEKGDNEISSSSNTDQISQTNPTFNKKERNHSAATTALSEDFRNSFDDDEQTSSDSSRVFEEASPI